jgi:hypothetical protein
MSLIHATEKLNASRISPIEIMPNPYTDPAVVELLLRESPRHGLHAYHVFVCSPSKGVALT